MSELSKSISQCKTEIIFRDTDDKIIGTKLTELFAKYNQKAIGMKSLLIAIYPLEKTSLFQKQV